MALDSLQTTKKKIHSISKYSGFSISFIQSVATGNIFHKEDLQKHIKYSASDTEKLLGYKKYIIL